MSGTVLDHWLAKGVDGFRLDVAGTYLHDTARTAHEVGLKSNATKSLLLTSIVTLLFVLLLITRVARAGLRLGPAGASAQGRMASAGDLSMS